MRTRPIPECCPVCRSPRPERHPMGAQGPKVCTDDFHMRASPKHRAIVKRVRARRAQRKARRATRLARAA